MWCKSQDQSSFLNFKMSNTITVNNVEYIRVDSISKIKPSGNCAVVVVDRGWIFAGDITRKDGRIRLSRALHVFKWESIGFAKMIETAKADLRSIADVDIPQGAEIFCIPVSENWGIK
jgi:hypothetical protein